MQFRLKGRSKYGNEKPELDGIKFDSLKEMRYYALLKMLKKGGAVVDFERQVKFELIPKYRNANGENVRAMNYIADFVVKYPDHVEIVDVKGFKTKEYLLKKKFFNYKYVEKGYFIKEV